MTTNTGFTHATVMLNGCKIVQIAMRNEVNINAVGQRYTPVVNVVATAASKIPT